MSKLTDMLNRSFAPSVDSILAGINKLTDQLERAMQTNADAIADNNLAITQLEASNEYHGDEYDRAQRVHRRLTELMK